MPGAIAAMSEAAAEVRLYPDAGAWALRDALAARLGLDPAQVLPGAGVDGLIKLMCLALLDPGDEIAMAWPSFLSWRQGAQIQGATARLARPARRTAPTTSTRCWPRSPRAPSWWSW